MFILPHPRPFPIELGKGDSSSQLGFKQHTRLKSAPIVILFEGAPLP